MSNTFESFDFLQQIKSMIDDCRSTYLLLSNYNSGESNDTSSNGTEMKATKKRVLGSHQMNEEIEDSMLLARYQEKAKRATYRKRKGEINVEEELHNLPVEKKVRCEFTLYEDWRILETKIHHDKLMGYTDNGHRSRTYWRNIKDPMTDSYLLLGYRSFESIYDRHKHYLRFLTEEEIDRIQAYADKLGPEKLKDLKLVFEKKNKHTCLRKIAWRSLHKEEDDDNVSIEL